MNKTTDLTYEECIPSEREKFALMLSEFNRAGIQYTTFRSRGLIVIRILVGSY